MDLEHDSAVVQPYVFLFHMEKCFIPLHQKSLSYFLTSLSLSSLL